jgi:catechol 2,3-dioxygenase-like lactoylglutathione lyase family enzyme
MLAEHALIAFVATRNPERARRFYQEVLGLRLVADEPSALVFDAHGTVLRVQKVSELSPHPFTTLGWRVPDIDAATAALEQRGVRFESYPGLDQNERGVWTSPGGARVAWFKDTDGNTLSLTQV